MFIFFSWGRVRRKSTTAKLGAGEGGAAATVFLFLFVFLRRPPPDETAAADPCYNK